MKQLHIVPDIAVSSGGRGMAALRYSEAISKAGADVTVFATSPDLRNLFRPAYHTSSLRILNAPFVPNSIGGLIERYRAIDRLCEENRFDLVHLHGVWLPLLALAAIISTKRQIPFVVSPHGGFEPWALNHKRTKKWLALKSYQGFVNRGAAMFFATARKEVESLRRLKIPQPVAMIPIGIDVGGAQDRASKAGKRSILFLSRIHPVKGLLDLVEAWAQVRNPSWRVVVAGPDEGGHRSKVEELIKFHRLETDFEFIGLVDGERKQACFENADLFILPSYSENFGISVIEALANQLPVITTTATPWRDLEANKCGWWVDPGVAGISAALRMALGMPSEELERMGKRGRQLIVDKYSFDKVGQNALLAYEWILGRIRSPLNFIDIGARIPTW